MGLPVKNEDVPMFPEKNMDFPMKYGDCSCKLFFSPEKNVDFPCNIFPCTSPLIPGDGARKTWKICKARKAAMAIIEVVNSTW